MDAVPAGGDIWSLAALLAYTGCRPRELCDVKIEDVTEESITILKSKTEAGHPEWVCKVVLGHEGMSILDKHYVKSQGLTLKMDTLKSVSYDAVDTKNGCHCLHSRFLTAVYRDVERSWDLLDGP